MNSKELKEQLENYLRYKYEYYILCKPTILDSDFDKFEKNIEELCKDLQPDLKELYTKVLEMVDFPTIKEIEALGLNPKNIVSFDKRDETKYPHYTPMISIQKIQVNDENDKPYDEYQLFLNRRKVDYVEGSPKYDGNGIENIYIDGKLHQALTRGDKLEGCDRTTKMKLIVPNEISFFKDKIVEVRGELVIDIKLWERKYSDPDKPDNPRNYIGGVLNNEKYSLQEINELVYVAYSLVVIDKQTKKIEYPDNSMELLEQMGFNQKHKPFFYRVSPDSKGFDDIYEKFKEYREECPYLLDGIVVKMPEIVRSKMGTNNKYPYWCVAIKFESQEVSTYILDYEWTLGTNGEMTPTAILEPVELLGTKVTRASLSNLGNIIRRGLFPGAKVAIKKSGEIIPYVTGILEKSPKHDEYLKEIKERLQKFNIEI